MVYHLDDTICAIATAPGGAARGVVRISGVGVRTCLEHCFTSASDPDWPTAGHAAALPGTLRVEPLSTALPCDLYYWPTAKSYTREPAAELHTIGSPPLLQAVLRSVCAAGARLAEPGEFTLRAFLGGRLDLTQAEAVLGVIDAGDGEQLEMALAQLAGGVAQPLGLLRDDLLDLLAELEAGLDFVEEDISFITADELGKRLADAGEAVGRVAAQMSQRLRANELPHVVLIGEPNVGKSSLFNALARGARVESAPALVSGSAGTTRDYLTAVIHLDGIGCELVDTAGVDPDASPGSIAGAARVIGDEQHSQADVRLFCLDATRPLSEWERSELQRPPAADECQLNVWTKIDDRLAANGDVLSTGAIETSSITGEGLDKLRAELRQTVAEAWAETGGVVAATSARCRESLRLATESLNRARTIVERGEGEELVAAEVRTALTDVGKVVGSVYTDDLLDRIFSRFCIGK